VGGLDDDTYILDTTLDVISELAGQGDDTILASRAAVVMAANVEVIQGVGLLANNFVGNAGDNLMLGGGGNDTLTGGIGKDTLNGEEGIDRLVGGADDDVYLVGAGDVVSELLNQGVDAVVTSLTSYALGLNVERLFGSDTASTLTGNTLGNLILGGAGNDTLNGLAGNDTLNGGAGTDRLVGGLNDDLYVVEGADVVFEFAGQGVDTVSIETGALHTLAANVEVLVMTGAGVTTANGNILDNTILGGTGNNVINGLTGNDVLSGLGGNDILVGGGGRDTLVGGAGNDQFRFTATTDSPALAPFLPDRIEDFSFVAGNSDRIALNLIDANTTVALDQAFVYLGLAPFTGTAGELRVELPGGSVVRALGDVNGDQVADFSIDIVSATLPVAGWFIL
jgi:Ca2+-binding RTX toxin-like protein